MFHLLGSIPSEPFYVACSGGMDSVVLVDFLSKFSRNKFKLVYFDHGTVDDPLHKEFTEKLAKKYNTSCITSCITRDKKSDESLEEYWRNERYIFFHSLDGNVLTGHHLDDVVETWIFKCIKGRPGLIPYANKNVIRPFLLVPKQEIINWFERYKLTQSEDTSNFDITLDRNYIRHNMINHILRINPGIRTTVKNLVNEEFKKQYGI